MLNRVNCGEFPEKVTIGHRENIIDIWLRDNVSEVVDEDGTKTYDCDEAYFRVSESDCPERSDLEENFSIWFQFASEWEEPKPFSLEQLRADVDYLLALQ